MKQKLWILVFMCSLASQLVQGSDTDSIASDTDAPPVRIIEGYDPLELSEIVWLDRQAYINLMNRFVDFQYDIYNKKFSAKELEIALKKFQKLSQLHFSNKVTQLEFHEKLKKVAERHKIKFQE
jgi:hypothetical protein